MSIIDVEVQRLKALRTIQAALLHLKWLAAATRFEIAMCRYDRSVKAGFKPDQPRVPRGNPGGGQWTGEGGSSSGSGSQGNEPNDDRPEQPGDRPSKSSERMAVVKEVARRILQTGESIATLARMNSWLQTFSAEIETYNDPPRALDELQRNASTPTPGYDIHHIVEQTPAERDGFSREVIDSPDNMVRVPRLKHQEINSWYQTKNDEFDGVSPREYLSGRSWEVRRSVGLDALRKHGVLKP